MLSGWNCTPCTAGSCVADPSPARPPSRPCGEYLAVWFFGRHQRVIARGVERSVIRERCHWLMPDLGQFACTGTGARTTSPPNALAIDWWPRQTPQMGISARPGDQVSRQMPASFRACTGQPRAQSRRAPLRSRSRSRIFVTMHNDV